MADYPGIYLYKRIVQAKLFIDVHFGEPLDLDNISGEACFSKFHFTRLFKTIYGKTPHQYLTAVRLEKAKQLLEEGLPVTEVCFSVGFSSISSFTGLFKKWTGITPSIYQSCRKERREQMRQNPLQFIPGCFAERKGWLQKSNFQEVY